MTKFDFFKKIVNQVDLGLKDKIHQGMKAKKAVFNWLMENCLDGVLFSNGIVFMDLSYSDIASIIESFFKKYRSSFLKFEKWKTSWL